MHPSEIKTKLFTCEEIRQDYFGQIPTGSRINVIFKNKIKNSTGKNIRNKTKPYILTGYNRN